ncbi:MAG: AAA family ATPase [Candidatus Roizmanbacteria bacterium]|nr:AAA family ATPase [Candidatus Roizmanbacteria bacterium]
MQMNYEPPQETGSMLEMHVLNFTKLARENKLDPVIGRDSEVRRIMQILTRRTKNNPVLLGDPGVGKTALVEGLAQRIAIGDVPSILKNKEVISLDLASMLAGAAYRGEFEKRLKGLLKEIQQSNGKYILFIDEIHTLVGAGGAEGTMDAANMLKPALARGDLRAIGATTLREYRTYIEKDVALARRFQPVFVEEPTQEDSIAILRGLKQKYEIHHGIRIADSALIAAVGLSKRYIPDRFLPDKAIDLVDEAASALKIEIDSSPLSIDELRRTLTQEEIEVTALKREKDSATKKSVIEKQESIKKKREKLTILESRWNSQKKLLQETTKLRTELEKKNQELEDAQREAILDKAAELKYGAIPQLKEKLKQSTEEWERIPKDERLLKEEVTEDDIATIVARWTGIPVKRMLQSEREKLLHLEEDMHKRVIDQVDAIEKIARAIRRSRAGFSKGTKPMGVFLFVGPTGVGKTETAKALAYSLFNDEHALIRIDMSEYSEAHTISRLIGAPPGYIGFEQGGQLTEAVRRKPYSIVLFDEVEKAHQQIFNIFLQIFDDGQLTDGQGRVVSFTNTIIIMTSNLGSEDIIEAGKVDKAVAEKISARIQKYFKPEILNRIDAQILFEPLTKAMMKDIVALQLGEIKKDMQGKNIDVHFTDSLITHLVETGFDPLFGARPVQRLINEEVLDELAYRFIEGKIVEGSSLSIGFEKNKIVIIDRHA